MAKYSRMETSPEVWAVIRARHGKQLQVYSSFSDPGGSFMGDTAKGCMETEYALEGADAPLMGAETTWEIDPEVTWKRINEVSVYWLCVMKETDDEN